MKSIYDDFFGVLNWDERFLEWQGDIEFPLHGAVGIELPSDYIDLNDVHAQI